MAQRAEQVTAGRVVVPARPSRLRIGRTYLPSLEVATARWALPLAESRQAVCRDGLGLVEMGGLVAGDTSSAAVFVIDPLSGAVRATGSLTEAVHDAAAACLGDEAIVFGGGSFNTVGAVQAWSGSGKARVVGALPVPRSDLTAVAVAVGRTAYVVGGFDGAAMQPTVLATTDGAHFKLAGRLKVGVRYPAVAARGGYIWVAGGQAGTSEGVGDRPTSSSVSTRARAKRPS
ncbi:MAG TPA: hypothetical protein VFN61_17000 [Acidimicrobiales bacterium]|nr:hypothetical protein [Acidimicrobiales bacterium]